MMSWMQRAKAYFLQERQEHTDETDEMGVLSVSSVGSRPACEELQGVSSVSSVGSWPVCEKPPHTERLASPDVTHLAARGLSLEHAERVIDLLAERDDSDNRKSCAECASYAASRCLKQRFPIGDPGGDIALVLHRCPGFAPTLVTWEAHYDND